RQRPDTRRGQGLTSRGGRMHGMHRRDVLKLAGAAGAAATGPWWRVGRSQAQRAKKLVFWHLPNFTPLADQLQKEQVYEFAAKHAGLKESEVEYAVVAGEQANAKLAASIEAGNPPDVIRLYESNVQFYGAQGHLIDLTDQVNNLLWCYGGKMVESDNKTVVMNSAANVAGVKTIEAMFKTHKIIPQGAISWDNSGNNKAYQSRQAAFVMNPSSIYAYLDSNDKDLQKKTGLFPVPAGPKGTVNQIDTWSYGAFKKNPYPDIAKGLIEYFMQPANYDRIIQSTGGRWVPVYKRLFDSPFWREKP